MEILDYKAAKSTLERIEKLKQMLTCVRGNNDMHYSARHDMYQEVGMDNLLEKKIIELEDKFKKI